MTANSDATDRLTLAVKNKLKAIKLEQATRNSLLAGQNILLMQQLAELEKQSELSEKQLEVLQFLAKRYYGTHPHDT